ncbi:MAG: hypothetical protein ABFD69_15265 [Candidatus Sumerlaeia bacterium]
MMGLIFSMPDDDYDDEARRTTHDARKENGRRGRRGHGNQWLAIFTLGVIDNCRTPDGKWVRQQWIKPARKRGG